MKGLLIYPPNQLMDIETPRPDGSLGPLYLAATLELAGIKTDILDASIGSSKETLEDTFYKNIMQENGLTRIGMNFKDIAKYVINGKYDFVGISSNFTPQTKMAFETASVIKRLDKNIKIYAGGINARALKDRFLKTGYFDGICLTEGELIFPRMLKEGIENVPGFAYIKNNDIKINPITLDCFVKNLDDLPFPAWDKLDFDKYKKIASPHGVDITQRSSQKYAPIMTSRGCPWKCLYCHISKEKEDIGRLRTHSIERVIEEVKKLKSLGVKKLFFEDDSLFSKKNRSKEIFKKVKEEGVFISNVNGVNLIDFYDIKTRGWGIDNEFIELLKDSGFEQVVFPAESGSQRIINKYASGKVKLDKMNLPNLMKTITKNRIKAPVNIMIGFPDETEQEIKESIDLAKKLRDSGAPYVTFFIPIPFPGSQLYDIAIKEGYLDKNFNTDIMNWKNPVMKNTLIDSKRLEEIRDKANEEVNNKKYLEMRLKQSIGFRWNSN